jgi:DNA-binding beta-propeller fold protein YncE
VTDEKGKFHMKMPKQVFAQLDALDPAWVVRHLNLDHADHDLGEVEMVPAGRISGNVVLPDGKPAIGFRLYAGRFNAVRSRSFPPPAKPAKNGKDDPQLGNAGYAVTDAAGKFEIGGLYPEPHEVHVEVDPQRPSLLANSANSIAIRAGQTETTNFKLQTARHVVGRAFEIGSNRPITRVDIYSSVSPNPKRREFSQGGGSGLTNEQGEFEFYTLPGLSRILVNQADPDGKAIPGATQEVEIAADRDPAPVVFRLEPPKPGLFRPRFMKRMVVARANRLDRIVAFAFDSKWERVVTVASPAQGPLEGNQDVRVRRVADDKNLVQFETPETFLTDVAFSPDGETIITAGGLNNARRSAGELKIWDAESGELLHTLTGHTKMVLSVACSPDGKLIASGGFDRTVRIWNAETGVQTALFKGDSAARSLTFSRDGKTLVAGLGWSGDVKFWDTATFRELRTLKAKNLYLFSVALSPDGKRLAAAGVERDPDSDRAYPDRGRVHIWDLASGKSLPPIPLSNHASGVVFSTDGKYVLVASHIGEIFSAETGKEVGVIRRGSISGGEDKIRISLDGTRMAIGSPIDLSLWDLSGLGQPTK